MSVVVRMEMPKDKNCLFNFRLPKVAPWCWIEDKACDYYKTNNRPDWCPILCQLPEGHGRLVDADALHKIAWPVKDHTGRIEECVQMRDLYKAPTIVPAERSEHEAD